MFQSAVLPRLAHANDTFRYYFPWIGGAIPILIYVPHSLVYWNFTMEDAYISLRYAENFAQGLGLVFNPGERVEGYTNFLWVILLGVARSFYIDTLFISKLLGLGFGILTLVLLFKVGDKIGGRSHWVTIIAPVLFALYPGAAIWSIAGLETLFFTFWLVLAYYFYVVDFASGSPRYGFVFAIATMTRPEGALFFIIAWFNRVLWMWNQENNFAELGRNAFASMLSFVSIVGIWEIWRWNYYGYPLPNTFFLKASDPFKSIALSQGFPYISGFWNTIGGWVSFGFCLIFLFSRSPGHWRSLTLLTIIAWLVYLQRVNGDWMPWYRFFIPILPLIFLAIQGAILHVNDYSSRIGKTIAGIFIVGMMITVVYTYRSESLALRNYGLDAVETGNWLKEHVDSRARVAVTNAGAIPYYSRLYTLDYFGLLNTTIAHATPKEYNIDLGDGIVHSYSLNLDVDWLLEQHPDLIEIPGLLKDGQLRTYAPLAKLIHMSPRFTEEFDPKPLVVIGSEMIFRARRFQGIIP